MLSLITMANKHLMLLSFICLSLLVSVSLQVNGRTLGDGDAIGSHHPFLPLITAKPVEDIDIITHWAVYGTNVLGTYHGAGAKMNVYELPELKGYQASYSAITLSNEKDGVKNRIAAGVHVNPELYGDTKAHLFTYWTADSSDSTGCFNLLCLGFVQVNSSQGAPGDIIEPASVYNGEQRYITLTIKKDESTGDWSLYRDDLGGRTLLGYWPKTLFSNLADAATRVSWGGQSSFAKNIEKSPPMGSGHFPIEREGKAGYFKRIALYDGEGDNKRDLITEVAAYTDQEDCYKVSSLDDSGEQGSDEGYVFYYGGPGGCN